MNTLIKLFLAGASVLAIAAAPLRGPTQQTEPPDSEGSDVRIQVTQVDKSEFPKITVYVSVTNAAGEPVGISPERLVLTEGGVAIKPDEISGQGEIGPLTTLLVMDVSGSMNEAGKLAAAKSAAKTYVQQMRSDDKAGLVTFNTEVNYVQPITADHDAVLKAIDGLKARQDTAMYNALAQGTQILSSVEGRKAIIVLTDGLDNRSTATVDQVIEQIGPSGLSISTIGLGDTAQLGISNAGLDETVLKSLAERAGGTYGFADDPSTLRQLYERLGRTLQSEYVLTYTSPSTLRDGVNRNLAVRLLDADVSAETVYNPGGVVPEVPRQNSWLIFGMAFAALAGLLLAPALIGRGLGALRGLQLGGGKKKITRVKLKDESQPQPRPRVRMR